MARRPRVVVRLNRPELIALERGRETRDLVKDVADEIAATMRPLAPARTGAGRRSIQGRVEMSASGWVGTASWDEAHYYMGILNSKGRHFAEAAVQRVRYV